MPSNIVTLVVSGFCRADFSGKKTICTITKSRNYELRDIDHGLS